MSSVMDEYRSKRISAEEAAAMVKSGDTVDYYAFNASSQYLDAALAKRAGELENVTIRSELRLAPPMQVFMADSTGKAFRLNSLFKGPFENIVPDACCSPIPSRLGYYETIFRAGDMHTDIASFMVSPPDDDGYLYFFPSPALAKADVDTAKCFMAEINDTYTPFRGDEHRRIHISEVDYIIEGDSPPVLDIPSPPSTDTDAKIADFVAREIPNGACIQIGYGSVPNAVANLIAHSDLKDLGVQTEMLPEGIMTLYEAGKINGVKKAVDKGLITASFVLGPKRLVEFVRDCPDVYMCTASYTNNPWVIGQHENFISVNGCLEIDLYGQVNSECVVNRTISGTGGQLDFVLGAGISKGGKAILCTPSTYTRKDGTVVSRIVASFAPGTVVTTPRSCVHYVCTEYGIVNLRGRNLWERAELLIGIAHPDFRDDLAKQAETLLLKHK